MIKVWHYDNMKDELVLKVPIADLKKAFHSEKELRDFIDNVFDSVLYFSLSKTETIPKVNFNEPF